MRGARGFTMVELVVVLLLVGAVSVVALGRVTAPGSFSGLAFAQEVRAALRFAQKFAVTSGCDVRALIDGAADSYALHLRADAIGTPASCLGASGAFGANPLRNPQTGAAFAAAAPGGVDVTGALDVVFDAAGRTPVGGSVDVDGVTITVSAPSGLIR